MNIPNPKALPKEKVMVLNYRFKPPRWEQGECRSCSYENNWGIFDWHYNVFIDRGKKFFLYVGNEGISKI